MLRLGDLFLRSKKYDKAEIIFKTYIDTSPEDFRGHFNLGVTLKHQNRLIEALECMKKVIELSDVTVEAYGVASAVLLRLQRPEEALHYCTKCREVCARDNLPEDPICLYNLNNALRQLHRMRDAIALSWKLLPPKPLLITEISCPPSCIRISFICVKFGSKYSAAYVNALASAIAKHCDNASVNDRIICLTDNADGINIDIVDCRYI